MLAAGVSVKHDTWFYGSIVTALSSLQQEIQHLIRHFLFSNPDPFLMKWSICAHLN